MRTTIGFVEWFDDERPLVALRTRRRRERRYPASGATPGPGETFCLEPGERVVPCQVTNLKPHETLYAVQGTVSTDIVNVTTTAAECHVQVMEVKK
jgi:hypothetical protein